MNAFSIHELSVVDVKYIINIILNLRGGCSMAEVKASMAGSIWKVTVNRGDVVTTGQDVVILESMTMEIPIATDTDGIVQEIKVSEGDFIDEGDVLVIIE